MRIGITCVPTAGGSGVLATELGRELARRGHEIHFITSSRPHRLAGGSEPGIFFHEVQALHYPVFEHTPYTLALAARMAEVYRRFRLDLFHVHYAVPHAASAILARDMLAPCHAPIVTTLHGTDVTLVGQDPSYRTVVRYCLEKSDAVTAVSGWLKDVTETVFQPTRPVRLVHNFADPSAFRPGKDLEARSRLAAPGQDLLLHVSNFRPVKRVRDAVETFARVVASGRDAVLALAGEGPDLPAALELAERLGVLDRVRLLGLVEDVSAVVAMADLLLFPSDGESFGLVPLESLLCEVPVVGARAGGLPEVVDHGETGFLRPVGDVEGMAADAVTVLSEPARLEAMGREGRRRAVERFAPEAIVPRYEAIYRECLENKRGCCGA